MTAHATYREFRIAELRRQDLLAKAAQAHLGVVDMARGRHVDVATRVRSRLGGLLVRAGGALQGSAAVEATAATHPVRAAI